MTQERPWEQPWERPWELTGTVVCIDTTIDFIPVLDTVPHTRTRAQAVDYCNITQYRAHIDLTCTDQIVRI